MIMGESVRVDSPISLFPDNPSLKRPYSDRCLLDQTDGCRNVRRKRRKSRRLRNERRLIAKAPINTTQFLMNDDNRGNSPSSDWERFNSSESETEFERNEFVKDYETEKNDRLRNMCKGDLIKEYLAIEKLVNSTESKYKRLQTSQDYRVNPDYRVRRMEVLDQIHVFQAEIAKLSQENRDLAEENNRLLAENSASSTSGGSSSETSSSDSSSDDTSEEEEEDVGGSGGGQPAKDQSDDDDGRRDDTGYESDRSATSLQVSSST